MLLDISKTEEQSSRVYRYAKASPHLIWWGVIWFLGYGVTYLRSEWSSVWIPLVIVGVIGSAWYGAKNETAKKSIWLSQVTIALAILISLFALFAILPPLNSLRTGALFPILIGFAYSLLGICHRAPRLLATGVLMTGFTLIGYFFFSVYFLLWMSIIGGGGLILGGFWLGRL